MYLENTRPEHTHTRYADRKVVRAFADHNVEVFEFLVANGVQFADVQPHRVPAEGVDTYRRQTTIPWSDDLNETINNTAGSGLMRALEKSAREMARSMADCDPEVLSAAKAALRHGAGADLEAALRHEREASQALRRSRGEIRGRRSS